MIIGKKLIELFLKRNYIYCNPQPRNITEVSVDVTLGRGAWIAKSNLDCINPMQPAIEQFNWITDLSSFVLLPNQLLIAHTHEFVGSTVGWLTSQIRSRSTIARWGLEVGTAALFGEPGFCSRWALELHNTASTPIAIKPGWRVGQMIFQLTLGNSLYKRQYNESIENWNPETLLPKLMN